MENWLIGWLSPEGKFYECDYRDHTSAAEKICKDLGITDLDHADYYLCMHGWVQLTRTEFLEHKWNIIFVRKLTQEQHHFLKPYVEENIDSLSSDCNSKIRREFDLDTEY